MWLIITLQMYNVKITSSMIPFLVKTCNDKKKISIIHITPKTPLKRQLNTHIYIQENHIMC